VSFFLRHSVKGKISKGLGVIIRIRHYIPNHILFNLYYTLVHPYFTYCNIIWATGNSTSLNELFLLHKKEMRLITNSEWREHTLPMFNRPRVLTVFDINKLQIACFMYKAHHRQIPGYLNHFFIVNSDLHTYNTRQSSDIHISYSRTNVRQLSIVIYGAKIWNSIDDSLKSVEPFTILNVLTRFT